MKKAALHNLGCKVNAYETEAMQEILERNGYEIVPFEEKADIYIVNTCSAADAAPGQKEEPGCGGGGRRLLRTGRRAGTAAG